MGVKISKLFKDSKFQKLPETTRLLYIYLSTNPSINTVGVFSPNLDIVAIEVGCTMEQLRESTRLLIKDKFIYVKEFDNVVYFIIPEHFNTIPKSEATVIKVQKILKSLPDDLVTFLSSVGISTSSKVKTFVKPTAEEVSEYALSLGYLINGSEFVSYYQGQADRYGKKDIWVDTRGKQVNDWKGKLRKVWCKEDRKLKSVEGAPEGYDRFYIIQDGNVVQPEGWRNGKPFHKSISYDIALKKQFNK